MFTTISIKLKKIYIFKTNKALNKFLLFFPIENCNEFIYC